jgi:hypothetical protein
VLCPGWVNTRINEADRNRPADLQRPSDEDTSMMDAGRQMLDGLLKSGLQPSEVASKVLDAIREERFYILTHPEWAPMIEQRMQDILEGRTPAPSFFGA